MSNTQSELVSSLPGSVIVRRRWLGWDLWEPAFRLLIVLIGVMLLIWSLHSGALFPALLGGIPRSVGNRFLRLMLSTSSALFIGSLLWRTCLWFRYRPADSLRVGEWPAVTILLPVYNEGEAIQSTIAAIAASDYPAGKLKIIAVDDGSIDDTYIHLCRARERYSDLMEVIRFKKNRGKRQALYQGFQRAGTPFVVTIDSDTCIDPRAIRELLTPLLLDPGIGAATGRIRVLNRNANLWTRMLDTNFAMAFDFTRAIESTFRSVFCVSGAFSAYRTSILRRVIEPWLHQTFLGRPCSYGEDRSLANFILRLGCGTVFQRTAVAHTLIPESFGRILKMLTRWARSNIRESLVFSGLMFNHNRRGNYFWPFLEFVSTAVLLLLHLFWFYGLLLFGMTDGAFLQRALASTILFGFLYMLYFIRIEGVKEVPYVLAFCLFCSPLMVGIFTVAGFTLTTRRWSTR